MKDKTHSDKPRFPDFEANIRSRRYARRGLIPRTGPPPSALELATLAATLARSSAEEIQEKLCASALNLWHVAQETIALQSQCNADWQQRAEWLKAEKAKLPEPPESQTWPMTLDAFCKIILPGLDTGDHANVIKAWLKSLPTNHPDREMNAVPYAQMRSERIDKARFYFLRGSILPWYEEWKQTANSEKKRLNAKSGWKDCDDETQQTPPYQAYKAECEKHGKQTSKRGFDKWLKRRSESPAKK